jgi:Ca2+-binding RTX toxin-like protein
MILGERNPSFCCVSPQLHNPKAASMTPTKENLMKHGILKSKLALPTGALLGSLAIVALALLASSSMTLAAGGIVIHGSETTGSHLKLTVSGGNLVVNGYTESNEQAGCEFTHGQNALQCSLAGISQIEIDTGRSDDTVEVLEPLPVPLIAHLGEGADKFIGSEEPDTCYPEGSVNNNCDGGKGNDTCVTGSETTKCIGGPGDDLCEAGFNNDACYGGPGNDVCKMGAGESKCLGEDGNDLLKGGSGSDHLSGGPGNDRIYGESDSDKLYGDTGNDYVYGGSASDKVYGGPGSDHIYGEASPDKLYGGPGDDYAYGGSSPDKLYGEAGKDYCNGGPGVGRSYACESGPGR